MSGGVIVTDHERAATVSGWSGEADTPPTKQRILEAAATVFSEKGYYAAAVDDIVVESDTSKGSFYHFFPSKQGIFLALIDQMYKELLRRVEKAIDRERGALAKVDAALRTVLGEFARRRRLAKLLLIEAAGLGHAFNDKLFELHTKFAVLVARYLDEAVEEGSIEPLDTTLAAFAWLGAVNEVVMRWVYTGEPEPLEAALPPLRALLLRSIGVPPSMWNQHDTELSAP